MIHFVAVDPAVLDREKQLCRSDGGDAVDITRLNETSRSTVAAHKHPVVVRKRAKAFQERAANGQVEPQPALQIGAPRVLGGGCARAAVYDQ